jgi:hypothetical protein
MKNKLITIILLLAFQISFAMDDMNLFGSYPGSDQDIFSFDQMLENEIPPITDQNNANHNHHNTMMLQLSDDIDAFFNNFINIMNNRNTTQALFNNGEPGAPRPEQAQLASDNKEVPPPVRSIINKEDASQETNGTPTRRKKKDWVSDKLSPHASNLKHHPHTANAAWVYRITHISEYKTEWIPAIPEQNNNHTPNMVARSPRGIDKMRWVGNKLSLESSNQDIHKHHPHAAKAAFTYAIKQIDQYQTVWTPLPTASLKGTNGQPKEPQE